MIQDFVKSSNDKLIQEEVLKVERWMVPNPYYIDRTTSLREAAEMMEQLNVECIPIVDENMYPVGMVTLRLVLKSLINGYGEELAFNKSTSENNFIVPYNQTLTNVLSSASAYFSVIDGNGFLIGVLSRKEILKGLTNKFDQMNKTEHVTETLSVILESAYEGITVVDEEGIIREFNHAYSRFTGIDRKHAIGKNVKDVIDNTNLHHTVKTGLPQRGAIQYIQGQAMIVHRIPIWNNDRVIGAIGMLIFEGVSEVYRIYEKLQEDSLQKPITQHSVATNNSEAKPMTLDQIIGDSESTYKIKRLVRKVAKTDATVLVTGESGTGKELYARSIHNLSNHSSGPFISLNCGAIPESLFESELFGYEKGAFTGAKKDGKLGKFELAQNGTLFLDEIGEMPLMMQTKLLRVLQEKEVDRIGGVQKYEINTRIIAATNRDLKQMVEAGDFREDLYYRINVIEIPIAPLRERIEDIPALVSYYSQEICNKYQMPVKVLTSEAMAELMRHHWSGNIRELVNTLEKLAILVDEDIIELNHLPDFIVDKQGKRLNEGPNLIKKAKYQEDEKEKDLIRMVLSKTDGNKSQAAKQLGIHRTTLYQKLKKYGLDK